MLVLSRKVNECVVIEGVGTVMLVDIRGDKVRLGFDIDPALAVHRSEVQAAIDKERRDKSQQEAAGNETPETIA